jgi:asparagine synthase (glutamine-hydrolysing)
MCGICGIINFKEEVVKEASIRQMMQIMKHRGPDDEGVFFENNVGLGFVRLSIIDLTSSGHQPMMSIDGRYVIVFNGEIYNYIELRKELQDEGIVFSSNSDTEVLLNSYIKWGGNCLNRFNGMWAFVIYDLKEKKVFAARDRFGVKPFYFLKTEDYFAFSSEIRPLLSLLGEKPDPDYQSIFDFLVFNRTDQTEDTFFDKVKKLLHGHSFTLHTELNKITASKLSIVRWYDLKKAVSNSKGFNNSNDFKELFSSAVSLRLRSDVPVGVCLSGGIDSSSIVSILLKDYNKQDLNTFSAIYGKGQFGDESEYIQEFNLRLRNMFFITPTSETLKNDLHSFVKAHAEPIPSTSPYAQFKVMNLAKGKVVVTLDGQGADEQLAGYHYFFGFFFKDLFKKMRFVKLFSEMIDYLKTYKSFYGLNTFVYLLLPDRLRTRLRLINHGGLVKAYSRYYKFKNSISKNLYGSGNLNSAMLDHFEYKLEHLLKWEDINSMYFSIEARVPFLDHRLVERVLATKSELIISGAMTKQLLRKSMEGIVPEKIRLRLDKMGFETPQDAWFRTPTWQAIINEVLFSQSFKDRNLVNPKIAIAKYKKHIKGKINCASEIWKWIHLELWFREFID